MEYRPEDTPSVPASEDPSVPTDATAAARGEPAPPRPLPETGQPPLSPGLAASPGGGADPDTMGWRLPSISPSPGSYPNGSGTDGWSPYGGTPYGAATEPNLYVPGTSSPYAPPGGWQDPRPGRRQGYRIAAVVGALLVVLLLAGTFALGHQVGASSGTARTTSNGTATIVTLPPSAQDLQQTVITVIHTVQPTVVEVKSQGDFGEAIGSGVIVRQDGYIVTNNHVVQGYSQFTVTLSDGTQQSAQVVGEDAQDDLAVLKITASNLRPIAIADSSKIQVGEFALALGNPLGLEQSATLGIVSALNRTASEGNGGPTLTGLVQTSAPINPGNSGGALVDLQGQLIGIPTLGAANSQNGGAANGIGFAIPANRVSFVVTQLINNGHLTNSGQGFLGIRGQDVSNGVLVLGFANDAAGASPAQRAGIRTNDVIVAVNGQTVTGNSDLSGALLSQSPGAHVTVTVQRGSSRTQVTVTLGERPANG